MIRFGFSVQLRVQEADFYGETHTHFLANNLWDVVDHAKQTVSATATKNSRPVARNVFVITPKPQRHVAPGLAGGAAGTSRAVAAPPPGSRKTAGELLCYGDVFCLASNPSLRVDAETGVVAPPYYLVSERPNNILGSGNGNRNEVALSLKADGLTLWTVYPADGDLMSVEGLPVPASAPVMIMHRATNQPLGASLDQMTSTDFGAELVVHAFRHQAKAKTSDPRSRPVQAPNRWEFVLADDPAAAEDTRVFRELTPELIIEQVKQAINERGAYGIRGLARAFRIIDDAGDGALDREDFKWGLFDYGVRLSDEEFAMVLAHFDRDGNGVISFDEFLRALRDDLSPARREIIAQAYSKLDANCDGTVTFSDIRELYDASSHPDVLAGRLSSDEALRDFMSVWNRHVPDDVITFDEFLDYYTDVSCSVDTDGEFLQIVRNAWRLPGADQLGSEGSLIGTITFKSGRTQQVVMPPHVVAEYGLSTASSMLDIVEALEQGMGILGVYRAVVRPP